MTALEALAFKGPAAQVMVEPGVLWMRDEMSGDASMVIADAGAAQCFRSDHGMALFRRTGRMIFCSLSAAFGWVENLSGPTGAA